MQYSPFQEKIFHHAETVNKDLVVKAVPGSGKTTTIKEIVNRVPSVSIAMLAFNKHIADELSRKVKGATIKTSHGFGMRLIRDAIRPKGLKPDLKFDKYRDHLYRPCKPLVETGIVSSTAPVSKLLDLIRVTDTPISTQDMEESRARILKLLDAYSVLGIRLVTDTLIKVLDDALQWGFNTALNRGVIDFTDMLWVPVEGQLHLPESQKYEYLLVDELQDFNQAQLELLKLAAHPEGVIIGVGDPHQSCYGFNGANADSIDRYAEEFDAVELPLSICYRCPTSHIELAAQIYPGILPREDAPEGSVMELYRSALLDRCTPESMILSRKRSPLVKQFLEFLVNDVPAQVKGQDIVKEITRTLEDVAEISGFSYKKIHEFVEDYVADQTEVLKGIYETPDNAIAALVDRTDALTTCIDAFPQCYSVDSLKSRINQVFEGSKDGVMLSTIHGAKGLESSDVYILEFDTLPFQYPGQSEQATVEENNLEYIAKTRSTERLGLVYADGD